MQNDLVGAAGNAQADEARTDSQAIQATVARNPRITASDNMPMMLQDRDLRLTRKQRDVILLPGASAAATLACPHRDPG